MKKLGRIIPILFLAALSGCHPKVGDYYENRATRERVKITQIGQGKDLHRFATYLIGEPNVMFRKTRGYDLMRIEYSLDDSLADCILYDDPNEFALTLRGIKPFVHYWIAPVSKFEQDFVRVE